MTAEEVETEVARLQTVYEAYVESIYIRAGLQPKRCATVARISNEAFDGTSALLERYLHSMLCELRDRWMEEGRFVPGKHVDLIIEVRPSTHE